MTRFILTTLKVSSGSTIIKSCELSSNVEINKANIPISVTRFIFSGGRFNRKNIEYTMINIYSMIYKSAQ